MTAPRTRRQLAAWLVQHTRPLLPPLGVAVLARVAGELAWVALLVTIGMALCGVAVGDPVPLAPVAIVLVLLSLGKAGLRYLEHYTGHWVAFAALQRLRELLFARLLPQAPAATTGMASARVTESAIRDIDRIEVFFAHTVPPVVAAVVTPAIALAWLALSANPLLAAIIAGFLAVALLLPVVVARTTWAASRTELRARGELATHLGDDVQGVREVLAFAAEPLRQRQLDALEARAGQAEHRIALTRALRTTLDRLLWAAALLTLATSGQPVTEVVIACFVLVALWFGSAGTDDFVTGLDAALAATERVRQLAEASPAVSETGGRTLPGAGPVTAELRKVSFAYPAATTPTVHEIGLRVDAGSWHHLIGTSGSGKSTIAALLRRDWDPSVGDVLLDGIPLSELSRDAIWRTVAVVDQRPLLFPGTVEENLRLGNAGADEALIRWALHVSCLDGDQLPLGLATRVLERGTTLSGGQLQRVALARALVSQPRLLVLDESLSQLDLATRETVKSRLREDSRATIIEVTHRADTLPDEAAVTVIDSGTIVEHGTVGDLRTRGGAFARLCARA